MTDQIPNLIELAEDRIYRELRCKYNLEVLDFPDHGSAVLALPADYREALYVHWDLQELEKRVIIHPWRYRGGAHRINYYVGMPRYWSDNGPEIVLQPSLDGPYDLSLTYFRTLKGTLVDDTDTNAVLTAAPDLYLYATLVVGQSFLIGDTIPLWDSQYRNALSDLNTEFNMNLLAVTENAS